MPSSSGRRFYKSYSLVLQLLMNLTAIDSAQSCLKTFRLLSLVTCPLHTEILFNKSMAYLSSLSKEISSSLPT